MKRSDLLLAAAGVWGAVMVVWWLVDTARLLADIRRGDW